MNQTESENTNPIIKLSTDKQTNICFKQIKTIHDKVFIETVKQLIIQKDIRLKNSPGTTSKIYIYKKNISTAVGYFYIPENYHHNVTFDYLKNEFNVDVEEIMKQFSEEFIKSNKNLIFNKNDIIKYNLFKNPNSVVDISKTLKKLGIEKINMGVYDNLKLYKELTLVFNTTLENNNDDIIIDKKEFAKTEGYINSIYTEMNNCLPHGTFIFSTTKKDTVITDNNGFKSTYIPNRNIILFGINPFYNRLDSVFHTEYYKKLIETIIKKITLFNIKKVDITDLTFELFVDSFIKKNENETIETEKDIVTILETIRIHEQNLIIAHKESISKHERLEYLDKIRQNKKKYYLEQLEAIKKINVITNIDVSNGNLELTYKDVILKIPDFMRDTFGPFGMRKIFLGAYKVTLMPSSLIIKAENKGILIEKQSYQHPHVNTDGKPCLGSGNSALFILKSLGEGNLEMIAIYMWTWLNTFINNAAYVKSWHLYDDRLKQGLPVWDENNNLIKMNEPARLKTNEQIKLTKIN